MQLHRISRLRLLSILLAVVMTASACDWPWVTSEDEPTTEDSTPDSLPFDDGDDDDEDADGGTTPTVELGDAETPDDDESEESGDDGDEDDESDEDEPGDDDDDSVSRPPVTPDPTTPSTERTTTTRPTTTAPTPTTTGSTSEDSAAPDPTTGNPEPTNPESPTSTPDSTSTDSSTPTSESTTTTTEATTTTMEATTTTTEATTTTTEAPADQAVLVWSDEFDTFDQNRWKKEHSTYGDGGKTLQCYTPQQVSVADGNLVLTAEKRTETCPNTTSRGQTREVTSGMVRSRGVTFSPGQRIEYRVKLTPNDDANQGGLWPALWASGWAGGGWPAGGEWDGFEVMTAVNAKRTVFGLHFSDSAGNHAKSSAPVFADANFSDDWHIMEFDYGLDGVMIWRMDGVVVAAQTDLDTLQGWPAPFDEAMTELKINLALGGNPGPLDERALPATFAIDYVRIYDLPTRRR